MHYRGPDTIVWAIPRGGVPVAVEIAVIVVTDYFSDEFGEMLEPADYGMDPEFPKESVVTVLFEETQADRTKLSIIYPETKKKEQMDAMLKSGMKEGWNSSLDKLEKVLASTLSKEAVM
jgi:uncharacterized protein YndB with AHSA1/START domain